jgi:polar amino acid transport system substrate-binding protein
MRSTRLSLALVVGSTVVALAGCSPTPSSTTTETSAAAPAASSAAPSAAASSDAASSPSAAAAGLEGCAKDTLKVRTAGKLTIGTDKPAYGPWFVDDTPSNGKGFESAVAYAVAEKLGFAQADVTWTVAAFNTVIAPGPKAFDFDVNQVSITDERKKNIDFSSGYYDVSQAVVTTKKSKAAGATTLAALKGLKIGAQVGTTSYKAVTDVIAPTAKPSVFNSNDDAKLALGNGQIDALVVDLPTALFISAVGAKDGGIDNGVLLGQLPGTGSQTEQFGLVLDKGSALTGCVSKAVDALRADGTLKKLEAQWLTDAAGAPVLK